MAKSQRTKIQIMVEIPYKEDQRSSNTNTTTETFEDTKVVGKRCKWIRASNTLSKRKGTIIRKSYAEDQRLSNTNPTKSHS